jgi:hypothetical protein
MRKNGRELVHSLLLYRRIIITITIIIERIDLRRLWVWNLEGTSSLKWL